jgi:Cu(I)/Ag(I) efflux system membrane fusion protein
MKKIVFLVIALISISIVNVYAQQNAHKHNQNSVVQKQEKKEGKKIHAILTVQGSCGMCKSRIEETAKSVVGVISAQWDNETKILDLNYDKTKTSLDAISKAIAKAGYDTDKDKADNEVYNALPGCCKYRK